MTHCECYTTGRRLVSEAQNRNQSSQDGAFFASRLATLGDLRHEIYRFGGSIGQPIWVSEHSAPELGGLPLDQVQVACLKKVRSYKRFICVLDGSYGSPWNASQISILELELFMAALAKRKIAMFLLDPFEEDPRLVSLLEVVRAASPHSVYPDPLPKERIVSAIARLFDSEGGEKVTTAVYCSGILGRLTRFLARLRSPKIQERFSELDVQFLNAAYVPISSGYPDKEYIESLIARAAHEQNIPDKLAQLWVAIRHLSKAPHTEPRYGEYLPLWEQALGHWASASAWYGLHGHVYLGRLAAVNSLLGIRSHMTTATKSPLEPQSIQGTRGAIASEYYSIAKLVDTWKDHRSLLKKALWNVDMALAAQQTSDSSGLLAIRGSIWLGLGQPFKAVRDYEESLRQRLEANEGAGRIGEAQVELGMAYLCIGHIWKAQNLLEAGVENLESSDQHPFTVRALRKLSHFYALTFRRSRSAEVLRRAKLLAEEHEIEGQLQQMG